MIINMTTTQIKKVKDKYKITLGEETIIVSEETVLKFRLFNDKDLDNLEEIKKYDLYEQYKSKAISYHLKYGKNSKEVLNYLLDKELEYDYASLIVNELIEKRIINDELICQNLAASLARNGNGPLMIKMKLKQKLFNDELINKSIDLISLDDYLFGFNKINDKAISKYSKLDDEFIKKYKIKEFLYRHGYIND